MQTKLTESFKQSAVGLEAESILRSCVHCGFCNATCPTYQLLGDELDGPRGRIYQIKQLLEGDRATALNRQHLDRCLTCRSCETTCPSGVQYGRLLDIGRELVEQQAPRPWYQRSLRKLLRLTLPWPKRLKPLFWLGQRVRPLLPTSLQRQIPPPTTRLHWPEQRHRRTMVLLDGCVQSIAAPNINVAAARLLDRLDIQLIRPTNGGCCGAVSHHLSAPHESLDFMRRNIDGWWPWIEQGAEAIVITASGCGVMVNEYGALLKDDPAYADKAVRVSALARDISEIVEAEDLSRLTGIEPGIIAFHSPCTLQHGQQLNGVVESLLRRLGFTLTAVKDAHLCCGSAGTYSILQPKLSKQLQKARIEALEAGSPELIATANIGCLLHLQAVASCEVRHWIELL